MSIVIDNIVLSDPVILAPMSGVTDLPYRKLVKKFGAGLVVSEMIACRAMVLETRQSMQKCAVIHDDATAASVQLAGCDPLVMAEAAKLNEDMGAKIIDINFGCPVKKVVGGNAGSALMRDEKLAAQILAAVIKAVKLPVTLKMRTGWDQNSRNAPNLAKIAEDLGIKLITVHGRTRCQLYNGHADWKFVSEVKKVVKVPVIVNGDITDFASATEALRQSNADGVMIGRGAYGKPWLISQIAHYLKTGEMLNDPSLEVQLETILAHFAEMLDYYGEETGCRIARKHIGWYSAGLTNSNEFRNNINRESSPIKIKEMIVDFYSKFI